MFKDYTLWELIKINIKLDTELLARTWWIFLIVFGIGLILFIIKRD